MMTQMLKEREELTEIRQGSKETAELSHRIRTRIKSVKEDAQKLQSIHKKDEAKVNDFYCQFPSLKAKQDGRGDDKGDGTRRYCCAGL
jgi:hypothetical protein